MLLGFTFIALNLLTTKIATKEQNQDTISEISPQVHDSKTPHIHDSEKAEDVLESKVTDISYEPNVYNDHIALQNVFVKNDKLFLRSGIEESSLVRWDLENPEQEWSFVIKFNELNLTSSEAAGIYLHYTKEKPIIGDFKGGNSTFNGMVAGIEFNGKAVDLIFAKNDGKDFTAVEDFEMKRDTVNPLRFKGVENLTMKFISTEKNFKIELYDDTRLLYDNFKFSKVKEWGLYKPGMFFGIVTNYKNVASGKSFILKYAQLHKRSENSNYNPYKSNSEKVKNVIRTKEEIEHDDSDIRELISKVEISNGYIKSILGEIPNSALHEAEEDLSKDLNQLGEKIAKVNEILKNKEKRIDLSHRINDFEIKIKQLQRSVKELQYIINKTIQTRFKSNGTIEYVILILGCVLLTIWATKEFSAIYSASKEVVNK